MAKQTINIGASPNDGTGTPLRTSFDYCNLNFTELYTATGPSGNNIVCPGSATITGALGAAGLNVTGATIPANGVYLGSANNLSFSAASALGMTLNSTGLGVGASPANKLDVNGGAAFTGFGINANPLNATSTSQRQVRFQNTGGDFYLGIEGSTGGGFFSGSTAYAACLYNAANTPLQFFTNGTLRSTIDTSGNVGIGVSTFGTSAAKVLSIGTGTEPTTGPAGSVQFFTSTRSASNTIPAIFTEGSGVTNAAITNTTVTNKIAIKVNGTIYYLLATTSAA